MSTIIPASTSELPVFNFTKASSITTIVLCVFNISVCTSKLPVTVRFVNVGDIVLVQALPLPTII